MLMGVLFPESLTRTDVPAVPMNSRTPKIRMDVHASSETICSLVSKSPWTFTFQVITTSTATVVTSAQMDVNHSRAIASSSTTVVPFIPEFDFEQQREERPTSCKSKSNVNLSVEQFDETSSANVSDDFVPVSKWCMVQEISMDAVHEQPLQRTP